VWTPENRNKFTERIRNYWAQEENRKKQGERRKQICKNHKFGLTEETKRKISKALLGRECRPETREKISRANSGEKNGMKKGHSEEAKLKIGESSRKHWEDPEFRKKQEDYSKTEAAIRSRSASCAKALKVGKRDTIPERAIECLLISAGIEFEKQKIVKRCNGRRWVVDFYLPGSNLIIECDGDYWHKYPTGTERDMQKTKELSDLGFFVVRIWEHEAKILSKQDLDTIVATKSITLLRDGLVKSNKNFRVKVARVQKK
jgi:very-short-patch-repair endonuclease